MNRTKESRKSATHTQSQAAQNFTSEVSAEQISERLAAYPAHVRQGLEQLRSMIITQAELDPAIGQLCETLKWGQLSYLTRKPQTGTTIRLGSSKKAPDSPALFVHCQTPLIAHFKGIFGDIFAYESTRALICRGDKPLPEKELEECIRLALRYHIDKKQGLYADIAAE